MKKSRLLNEVHETARGLAGAGALDQQTMRDIGSKLCIPLDERQERRAAKRFRMLR